MIRQTGKRWVSTKKLGPGLLKRLSTAREYDTFDVNITVSGKPAVDVPADYAATHPRTRDEMVRLFKIRCMRLQLGVANSLLEQRDQVERFDTDVAVPRVGKMEAFWINNVIKAELSFDTLLTLASRSDVDHVELAQQADQHSWLHGARGAMRSHIDPRALMSAETGQPTPRNTTWSVKRVGAPLLWQQGLTGDDVVVAVLDSGVNYHHPDLADHMWDGGDAFPLHGYDFERDDFDPIDDNGHGTSCAGIVAGNGKCGVATGVAPDARIMAVRIGATETSCWKGMQFALEHGAHIINMSVAWFHARNPNYRGWRRACETLLAAGVLHATSVGNSGRANAPFGIGAPGNCPPPWLNPAQAGTGGVSSAIACGATSERDLLDDSSGKGPAVWQDEEIYDDYQPGNRSFGLIKPDLCAPGWTDTCSSNYPQTQGAGAYAGFGRTSAASAHLAGSLALLAQACIRAGKPIVPGRMQQALEVTAVRIRGRESNLNQRQKQRKQNGFGAGRIDAYAAYRYGKNKAWWG